MLILTCQTPVDDIIVTLDVWAKYIIMMQSPHNTKCLLYAEV